MEGQAEIAFHYDSAPDGGPATAPTQIIRPLISASRVSSPSAASTQGRRFGRRRAAGPAHPGPRRSAEFASHVGAVWESDGYAPVTLADGTLPIWVSLAAEPLLPSASPARDGGG